MLRLIGTNTGIAGVDPVMFYDRTIEAKTYCIVYRMKHPFMGALKDCHGSYDSVQGKADYSPGITSLTSAVGRACARMETDTSRKCQNNDVGPIGAVLRRDPNDSLHYVITLRRRLKDESKLRMSEFNLPSFPVEFDYLIYRVGASDGVVTFLEHTKQDPTRR